MINVMFWFVIPVLLPRRDYTKASPQPVWLVFLLASGLRLQSGDDQYYVLVCDPSALTKKRLPEGLTPTSMACVSPGFRTPSSIGRCLQLEDDQYCILVVIPVHLPRRFVIPVLLPRRDYPKASPQPVWLVCLPTSGLCLQSGDDQCYVLEDLGSQCFYQEETTPRPHPNQYGLCVSRLQDSVFIWEMINVMFKKVWDHITLTKKRLPQGLTPTSMSCVSPGFRFRLQSGDDQYYVLVCDPIALIKKRLHQGLTPTSMACVSAIFRTLSSIGR